MKIELTLETAQILLNLARDYKRIGRIMETCETTEQAAAIEELSDEVRSARKDIIRAKHRADA